MSDSDDTNVESNTSAVRNKKMKYQQYKSEWEKLPEFKGWVQKSKKGSEFALCWCCNKDIKVASGKDALIKHSLTDIHKSKSSSIAKQPSVATFVKAGTSSEALKTELDIKEGKK